MRRFIAGITTLVLVSSASYAQADWPWLHKASVDKQRNNAWPQPFRGADAASVVAPFEVMKNNGWREHNTLGSLVFNNEHDLTEAGALKIEWILTQAPVSQRVIYVKSGRTQAETDTRVESVQLAVSQLVPTGPLPHIVVTTVEPPTSSGVYQNLIHRALIQTTPKPRVPAYTGLNTPGNQQVAPNSKKDGATSTEGNGGK